MRAADGIFTLVPRFYWGTIAPRRSELRRGSGYQFYRLAPLDVVEIEVGLGIEDYTVEAVEAALERLWGCVDRLREERADRITLGGVPVSAALGRKRVLEILAAIEARAQVPADAPLEALVAATAHLGCKRLAIGSRWADEVNSRLTNYLEDAGVEVAGITGRGQWASTAQRMSLEAGLEMALEVGREAGRRFPQADVIFVPGGAAMALHVIPVLESEFEKPVVTNLSVEVWNGLVRSRVIDPIEGWGQLLRTP